MSKKATNNGNKATETMELTAIEGLRKLPEHTKLFNTEHPNMSLIGELVTIEGEKFVRFEKANGAGEVRPMRAKLSVKWQPVPEAELSVLEEILSKAEKKKDTPKDDTENEPKNLAPLTKEEKAMKAELEKQWFELDEKEANFRDQIERVIPFERGKILNRLRNSRVYREQYDTFAEYAKEELKLTREHALSLAQIGEYAEVASEFVPNDADVSVRAATQLIRNQNEIAETLGLKKADKQAFAPLTEQVLALTTEAAKTDDGVKFTPRIVNAVNDAVKAEIANVKPNEKVDVIAMAAKVLTEKKDVILKRVENELKPPKTESTNGNNKKANNDNTEIYNGELPTVSLTCSLHKDVKDQKILQIGNGFIVLKCLCRFKMEGFALVPVEVNGMKVTTKK